MLITILTAIAIIIAAAWLIGVVWFAVKGLPLMACALWPLVLFFYKGPQ